jgi:hypothetical protein
VFYERREGRARVEIKTRARKATERKVRERKYTTRMRKERRKTRLKLKKTTLSRSHHKGGKALAKAHAPSGLKILR